MRLIHFLRIFLPTSKSSCQILKIVSFVSEWGWHLWVTELHILKFFQRPWCSFKVQVVGEGKNFCIWCSYKFLLQFECRSDCFHKLLVCWNSCKIYFAWLQGCTLSGIWWKFGSAHIDFGQFLVLKYFVLMYFSIFKCLLCNITLWFLWKSSIIQSWVSV